MYENRYKPLLSRRLFYRRLLRHGLLACGLMVVSLAIGMLGYRGFEGMAWVDAFCNASMILSGMGPADPLHTAGGKVFAGVYALFSGLSFIALVTVMLAPLFHRFLHKFHLEPGGKSGGG